MNHIQGDLLQLAEEGRFDVIVHGCNCHHRMGAGIAKFVARRFPEALDADLATPKGDRSKLGTLSIARIERGDVQFALVNAYTQFDTRGPQPRVSYPAISSCFRAIAQHFPGQHIAYPLIGAGLAGGDWDLIAPRIDAELDGYTHTLVTLPGA